MIVLPLLLASCFCVGFSYDEMEYGHTLRLRLHRKTQSLEFHPYDSRETQILWKSKDRQPVEDRRRLVIDGSLVVNDLTQKDSGRYIMKDKNEMTVSTKFLTVVERYDHYVKTRGESLRLTFRLQSESCNIYFQSFGENQRELWIVRNGQMQMHYDLKCEFLELLKPCGVLNQDLQTSCSGTYLFKDQNGNTALSVSVEVEVPASDYASKIATGVGVSVASIIFCACCKRCCCGKSSKKDKSEPGTPDAEPAVHYNEYDLEPVRLGQEQLSPPSGSLYPAQPSYTPSVPLIHNPPTNGPPAYSEPSGLAVQADAPTAPVPSDLEPRFELKGMNFASGSGSICDVYTSDKLNFL